VQASFLPSSEFRAATPFGANVIYSFDDATTWSERFLPKWRAFGFGASSAGRSSELPTVQGKAEACRADAISRVIAACTFDARIFTHTSPIDDLPATLRIARNRVELAINVFVKPYSSDQP
jgi:hypothetical protein